MELPGNKAEYALHFKFVCFHVGAIKFDLLLPFMYLNFTLNQMMCLFPYFQGSAPRSLSEQACRPLPFPGSGTTKTAHCG